MRVSHQLENPEIRQNFEDIENYLTGREEVVKALPKNPSDGQETLYVASYEANNSDGFVPWKLRYRAGSASAHKWEFVGGAALYLNNETQDAVEWETGAINTLGTVNGSPSYVIPFAGDWEVHAGYMIVPKSAAFLRVGTNPSGLDGDVAFQQTASAASAQYTLQSRNRLFGMAAATAITVGITSSVKQKVQTWNPHMFITPVRVG